MKDCHRLAVLPALGVQGELGSGAEDVLDRRIPHVRPVPAARDRVTPGRGFAEDIAERSTGHGGPSPFVGLRVQPFHGARSGREKPVNLPGGNGGERGINIGR